MTIKLLGARVAVEVTDEEYTTTAGIIIPATASLNSLLVRGKIVAVGSGTRDESTGNVIPVEVKVDDAITFDKSKGKELRTDNKVLILLEEKDIIAIIN